MRWILSIICLIALFYSYAQPSRRANIWYFGQNAGLDFNSGEPRVLTDGQINTDEGSAVISDENGNLLFYTDGETIWNRNHEIMPNGEDLKGSFTSTQSALIVPQPGSDRLYYVFTTAAQGNPDGFNYNVVDMTLDNGLGDVIVKNVQLYTPTTEKLTAVHHANGRDIWVITHKWESDEFYVYLVTDKGLNETPVISATGSRHEFDTRNAIGQLKANSQGNKLGLTISENLIVEVFDFNKVTGKTIFVNNLKIIPSRPNEGALRIYGLEISNNERYIYISEDAPELFSGQKIYQIDPSSGGIQEVAEVFIGGSLQLGPDGKIYATNVDTQELVVIDRPNLPADHPDFTISRISVAPGRCLFSLPNFIKSYFEIEDPLVDMPNVFTPNKDGMNEVFEPISFEHVETFRLKIVNRAGLLLYETTSTEGWWDGGNHAAGVYYWHLYYEGINGVNKTIKGWVQLIR